MIIDWYLRELLLEFYVLVLLLVLEKFSPPTR
jgi:hypothetical protein